MRSDLRRGMTVALGLAVGLLIAGESTARADWLRHTIKREVPAMDYRTGGVMMAPPIPYGAYVMDPAGCVHGALGKAHGLLGKLCSLCGQPGCGSCGGLGHNGSGGACGNCGGDGCGNCDGHGKLTTCGMLHGSGNGHGHGHGGGSGYIAPMAAHGGNGGNGLLAGLFGHKHKAGAGAIGGCASCGTGGLVPSSQAIAAPQAAPQSVAPVSACGLCGGKGRLGAGLCGGCGGKGLLAGLGNGSLRGCTTCGGQGSILGNACGGCGGRGLLGGHSHGNGSACDSPCGSCGGSGHGANGGNCGGCGGSGCLNGALQHVSGAVHGAAGSAARALFHKGEIEYFVGPGGPVPITPGYVPYVVPVRSPREFFAFPPMSDRATP